MPTFGLGIPSLPEVRRLQNQRPTYGADAAALAEAEQHLAGYRWRQCCSAIVEADASAAAAIPYGLPPGPVAGPTTHRFMLRVSQSATYLWLSQDYQADDDGTTEPKLEVELQDMSAVTLDPGVIWRRSDGTLPGGRSIDLGWLGDAYPVMTCQTGGRAPSAADVSAQSPPRLISLAGVTAGGARAQLVYTATACRLLSITAWEWAGSEI